MEKTALFCYGTLQSPLVMKAVTGQAYEGKEAFLNDWARYRVHGSEYPGIMPQGDSVVSGKLYWGLDEKAIEAVKNWKFEPGPESTLVLEFRFGGE